jgi:NitT/TauT family transport system permease protein
MSGWWKPRSRSGRKKPARWAWTYLIVAELIGTSSGITWFITQQARYQHFANVYAAIIIIGIIGLGTDMLLALAGRRLFPWDRSLVKQE